MKTKIILTAALMSQLLGVAVSQASTKFPETHGKLWFNASEDGTRFSISIDEKCDKRVGPIFNTSFAPCGERSQSVKVNADGTFVVSGFELSGNDWDQFSYSILKDGSPIVTSPELSMSAFKTFSQFLKNVTVLELAPTPMHLSTSSGIAYTDWLKSVNFNHPAEAEVTLTHPTETGSGWSVYEFSIRNQDSDTFQQADGTVSGFYLCAGSLTDVQKNYQWHLSVQTTGDPYNAIFYQATAPIGTGSLLPSSLLSPVIHVVGQDGFGGKWTFKNDLSDEYSEDPSISIDATCTAGVLAGSVKYSYFYSGAAIAQKFNHTAPLAGTCATGVADFDLKYTFIQTPISNPRSGSLSDPQHEDDVHIHVTETVPSTAQGAVTATVGGAHLGFAILYPDN